MVANPKLIEMLSRKAGRDVTTASGAEFLCRDIESQTGERIGINTVKRLVGIIDYTGTHREIILDILAHYLDFSSWKLLEATLNDKISGFSKEGTLLDLENLPEGQEIEVYWEPGRKVTLRHAKGREYAVAESVNSKLQKGDLLKLSQIAPGFPFYASDVTRKGESLGNYTAAGIDGIKKIIVS